MIKVNNDAGVERTEHVLYGTASETPCTCMKFPDGRAVAVALVTAPANSHEFVPAENDGHSGTFERHEAVAAAFAAGLVFRMVLNGRTTEFDEIETLIDHPRIRRTRWRARDGEPASRGTCMLFLDEFHRQATLRFELLYRHENLTEQHSPVPTLNFHVANAPNLREMKIYDCISTANLFQGYTGIPAGRLQDAGGGAWEGCLPFETPAMAAARGTHPEALTQTAQLVHSLYAGVENATWGLWKVPPLKEPTITQDQRDRDNTAQRAYRHDAGSVGNVLDPDANLGNICSRDPHDAGAQAGFGGRTHDFVVGDVDVRSLRFQHRASMRAACRPVWYTEASGEMLVPSANTFPAARIWDERIHFPQSPDNRFRRAVGRGSYFNEQKTHWGGHDAEHVGWMHEACDVMLTGSGAMRYMLTAIQSNMNAHVGSLGESRAVGRWALGAATAYWATGVTVAMEAWNRLWPDIRSNWLAMCAPSDPYRPFATTHTGFGDGFWGWMSWQSGILIAGLDAMLRMDDIAHVLTPTIREEMQELLFYESRALINVAFAPEHPCGSTIHPDITRWVVTFNLGNGVRPVFPTTIEYCADQPPNQKVAYGGFSVSWVIFGVPIARRIHPDLAARCDKIMDHYRAELLAYNPSGNTRRDKHTQYLSTN